MASRDVGHLLCLRPAQHGQSPHSSMDRGAIRWYWGPPLLSGWSQVGRDELWRVDVIGFSHDRPLLESRDVSRDMGVEASPPELSRAVKS